MSNSRAMVTGIGVITPTGIGVEAFTQALRDGKSNFSQISFEVDGSCHSYPVAAVDSFDLGEGVTRLGFDNDLLTAVKRLRNLSTSTAYATYCSLEAWNDAGLADYSIDPTRVAIVSGGSNTQQDHLVRLYDKYRSQLQYLNPNYGINFFDTDVVGVLSQLLNFRGEGFTVGAASASGNMALIQGSRLIRSGLYDIVLVAAPLMQLSFYEFQAFTALGAMARSADVTKDTTAELCRPFDSQHRGFVYGQCAGSIVLEPETHVRKRAKEPYGLLRGHGSCLDANRKPNPSEKGERRAMQLALEDAGVQASTIDYINTHGTGSVSGDRTEADALISVGLNGTLANSTKSLIGHGLSAAGLVEAITCLIQMKEGFLHQSSNLLNPITDQIQWVVDQAESTEINHALNNSFGFGGINTSLVLTKV